MINIYLALYARSKFSYFLMGEPIKIFIHYTAWEIAGCRITINYVLCFGYKMG